MHPRHTRFLEGILATLLVALAVIASSMPARGDDRLVYAQPGDVLNEGLDAPREKPRSDSPRDTLESLLALAKAIRLRLDFRTDVEAPRSHFVELVENSEDWDGEHDSRVDVTDVVGRHARGALRRERCDPVGGAEPGVRAPRATPALHRRDRQSRTPAHPSERATSVVREHRRRGRESRIPRDVPIRARPRRVAERARGQG